MPAAEPPACVFCGKPIGPADETAGRPPMAAHATCADAALADDAHWDAVSDASPREDEPADGGSPSGGAASSPRDRAGCFLLGSAVLLTALAVALLGRGMGVPPSD